MKLRDSLLIVLIFAALIISCSRGGEKVRLGILPAIDTLPLLVAETEGLFKAEGLDVELVMFSSALEKEAAVSASALHGSFGDPVTALMSLKNPVRIRILTEASRTGGSRMFAIVASPESSVKSIKEIGRRHVTISSGSIIEFFLDELSDLYKVNPGKLEVKGIPLRYQMLMTRQVDFAMLPEPMVSKAVLEGATVIADDMSLDVTATVISFREDFLEKNPGFAESFTAAYNKSIKMINNHPEKYRSLLVSRLRLPEELKESFTIPVYNEVRVPPEKDIKRVYNWMKNKGLVEAPLEYEKIIWKQ